MKLEHGMNCGALQEGWLVMAESRCPVCGYTKRDAQIHGDHRLCKNSRNAPWERKRGRTPKRISKVDLDEVIQFQRYLRDLADMPTLDFYQKYQKYMELSDEELAAIVKRISHAGNPRID